MSFRGAHALLAFCILLFPLAAGAQVCLGDPQAGPAPPAAVASLRAYRVDFRSPTRLAVGADDTVYVADPRAGEIVVREASGRVRDRLRGIGQPVSIAVDGAGRLYVGDAGERSVRVYGPDLEPLFALGSGPGEFGLPGDIAVHDATGTIYVSDSNQDQVRMYAAAGSPLGSFGISGVGDGEFVFPSGVHVDATRNEVLVTDQLNYRVQVFDLQGGYKFCLAGSASNPSSPFQGPRILSVPQGLTVDAVGRVYVADSSEGWVTVLDRGGVPLQRIGSFGSAPGQLRIPMDVVIDSGGRLFVSAANNGRLEVFGLDDFHDPERIAPALLQLEPKRLVWGETETLLATFRVPGHRLSDIEPGSISANGITPGAVTEGDFDGDGRGEIRLALDAVALAETLPSDAPGDVVLRARLPGLDVEGSAPLSVIGRPDVDEDRDRVPDDSDVCPGSAPGQVVDADGCSVAQLCACERPDHTYGLRRYWRHFQCVVQRSHAFQEQGLIDKDERRRMIRQSIRTGCESEAGGGHGHGRPVGRRHDHREPPGRWKADDAATRGRGAAELRWRGSR